MTDTDDCEDFFEGVAGDDLSIPLQLLDPSGNPEKLGADDGVTEIVGEFADGDGALVQVKLTDGGVVRVDATCGRITIEVASAVSVTLKTNRTKKQTFSVHRIKNGKKRTWVLPYGLLLKPRPVPAS